MIEWFDGKLRFMLAQPAPTGDTDSIAMDRELILKFAQPVSAGQVDVVPLGGLRHRQLTRDPIQASPPEQSGGLVPFRRPRR